MPRPRGFLVWQAFNDILQRGHETHNQQAICLVKNQGIEVAEGVLDSLQGQVIAESSRSSDQDITTLFTQNRLLLPILILHTR